jgi:tetratricopeptide (TPR) repeat protein
MKTLWKARLVVLVLAGAAAAAYGQAWRGGQGRVEGTVKDPQGNPIADASVAMRLQSATSGSPGPDLKTNKKGHWAILGIIGGMWNVDISAPGYQTKEISYNLKEFERNPNIDVTLAPEVKQEAVKPHEEITVAGKKVSKETADALEKGNAAMNAKDYATARAEYEKAAVELPDNDSLLRNLELSSYFDNKFDEALKYARQIVEKDPTNTTSWIMIAELEIQKGDLAASKAAIEKVPADKITDPVVYMNLGIVCYNKNNPAEADEYFTKALAIKNDLSEAYYYRGLARYQAAGSIKDRQAASAKRGEAKADFQKYLEIDPSGKDADTVKELLKSIK